MPCRALLPLAAVAISGILVQTMLLIITNGHGVLHVIVVVKDLVVISLPALSELKL
jgi:hypothetical protein